MKFVTVYHDACIENLLLRLILLTFRMKLKALLRQISDFTLSPPIFSFVKGGGKYGPGGRTGQGHAKTPHFWGAARENLGEASF